MKKLKLINLQIGEILIREHMKNVVGGDYGGADLCPKNSLGLCEGNCATSTGAAAKCEAKKNDSSKCTCGGL